MCHMTKLKQSLSNRYVKVGLITLQMEKGNAVSAGAVSLPASAKEQEELRMDRTGSHLFLDQDSGPARSPA